MDSLCDLKRGEFNMASWPLIKARPEVIMRLLTSLDDRALVIYGQGHTKLLRSFMKDSPDLQLVDPLTVLK